MWRRLLAALLALSLFTGTVVLVGCSEESKEELDLSDSEGK